MALRLGFYVNSFLIGNKEREAGDAAEELPPRNHGQGLSQGGGKDYEIGTILT